LNSPVRKGNKTANGVLRGAVHRLYKRFTYCHKRKVLRYTHTILFTPIRKVWTPVCWFLWNSHMFKNIMCQSP